MVPALTGLGRGRRGGGRLGRLGGGCARRTRRGCRARGGRSRWPSPCRGRCVSAPTVPVGFSDSGAARGDLLCSRWDRIGGPGGGGSVGHSRSYSVMQVWSSVYRPSP